VKGETQAQVRAQYDDPDQVLNSGEGNEIWVYEPDIGFWKVAKIFHFLATFQVHPWTILTFHEPVPQMIEWLGKLVHEPLCGS
jgi:hypothetical protein